MGIPNIYIARNNSLVHNSGVCDERALSIVSLRAMAARLRHFLFEFIFKANITIAETNMNYKTYTEIIRLSMKISEGKGMSA